MTNYMIGTSGWDYDHWQGVFYPEDLKKSDRFSYYSDHFQAVEINYSFYRSPSKSTIDNWLEMAPAQFKFTLKAHRYITHMKKLIDVEDSVRQFYDLGDTLKQHMGCFLFQLHPNLKLNIENYQRLRDFLEILDGRRHNIIEFRDPSWWAEKTCDLLREYNATFCSVNGLEMPEDIVVTNDLFYLRLHGEDYSTKYSSGEIQEYAERISELNCSQVYVHFNNDKSSYAAMNAKELQEAISQIT